MPTKKDTTKTKKILKVLPPGARISSHISTLSSSPELPVMASQGESLEQIDGATASHISAPVYVTEDVLSSTLQGLEGRLAALIASSIQMDRKHARSPCPTSEPLQGEQWAQDDVLPSVDQEEKQTDDSSVEETMVDEPFSASQSEKLLIQTLTEMVCSTFMLPLTESPESSVSSLGSLKPSHPLHAFPVHALLEQLVFAEWDHLDEHFLPPNRFSVLYPMEEKFTKRWKLPAVDAAISRVNKSLSCPVDNAQMLKDPTDKKLESLLKFTFSLAGAVTQPTVAAIDVCQSLKDQFRQALKEVPAQQARELA
ncbi:hypothetical protein AB205_0089760 [Aquarana catesbeiana]|uniref:Uncharacterized protein n=1 Tax=Aquarana catesbeiana TaxID=8400 RepID=A0A2G9RXV7_AQUCT|nr:hypothetical protein AB205_0089760 [Aquarana catesbeiana]